MVDTAVIESATKHLRIERDFKAPIERVFEAFTDPAQLQKWWGPAGVSVPGFDMDVREGGAWRTVMRNEAGESWIVSGSYVELRAPHRLAFTWGWEENGQRGHETLVEIDLVASANGTRLTLLQSIFETSDARDRHEEGWTSSFSCLETIV
jgi:uncharacterized protein YndB with AHSA1/START domain